MNYSNAPFPHVASPQVSLGYEEISFRAYQIWQREGCPVGRDEEIWLNAEVQLRAEYRVPETEESSTPRQENVPTRKEKETRSSKASGKPLRR